MSIPRVHTPRDVLVTDENGNQYIVPSHDSFWYSTTGNIIKWVIFLVLLFSLLGFFIIGRLLAQRRLRQGKAPAKWNRWLLNRHQRAQHEPRFRPLWPGSVGPPGYAMNGMPPHDAVYAAQFVPAPAYNAAPGAAPPVYQPPEGATKVDPVQTTVRPVDGAAGTGQAEGHNGRSEWR